MPDENERYLIDLGSVAVTVPIAQPQQEDDPDASE